jgi:adenylate cyclase
MWKRFKSPTYRRLWQGVIAAGVGFSMAILLWMPGWLDLWELKSWDWRVNLLEDFYKSSAQDRKIRIILLDQNSLDWGKQSNDLSWPWPREIYGKIIDFCRRGGVKSVGFDVLFTEPSKYGVEDDQSFGKSIQNFGKFTAALFLGETTGEYLAWPRFAHKNPFSVSYPENKDVREFLKEKTYSRASFPILEISQSAFVLANVHINPDIDGVYRRVPLFHYFDGQWVPSLGLAVFLSAYPELPIRIQHKALWIGDDKIAIDKTGRAILRFRNLYNLSGFSSAYSAAAIIQSELKILQGEMPDIDPKEFRNCYVLFGYSAPGLFDLKSIPLSGVYPGVMIHATMLENILSQSFIKETSTTVFWCVTLFLVLFAGVSSSLVSHLFKTAAVYITSLFLPLILCAIAYVNGYWLPLVVPETAVMLTLVSAGLVYYNTEGRQKRFIKNAFQQYLSPAVIEELIEDPDRLKLGGERRQLSIFFSDLEGFTSISEKLSPEELTSILNEYLSAMTEIIHEEGGTVDKYEGDAIIAFWNAPLSQKDHAVRCVKAALRCQKKLAELRPYFKEKIQKDLKMRIGINTGAAVVGNMGSKTRFDYTMMGDAVNLASRLEGINKEFGSYTMISKSTLVEIGNAFSARELSRVRVVGKKESVAVYEPMFEEEYQAKKSVFDIFSYGLQSYYQGDFEKAHTTFTSIAEQDAPARSYVEKCRELMAEKPEPWDGTWIMTKK